ncbi:hypothetical protein SUGI_1140330 [Cryptomeria japonica]|nr:hypothetical protein SUGI_1140330 [Cryptomeria japonica]
MTNKGSSEISPDSSNIASPTDGRAAIVINIRQSANTEAADLGVVTDWDLLKSIVYGGLTVSITSLGVVSSAAGGDAKTLTVIAISLANLVAGFFLIIKDILYLHHFDKIKFEDSVGLIEFRVSSKKKKSLERLRVLTCCNVPVIKNLEQLERLQRLELSTECNISTIEPSLQTIKKWPYECVICARTEHAVESVVNSFAFPGLTLVDSCMEEIGSNKYRSMLRLRCRQRRSSSMAVMVCFAINSSSANTFLTLEKKNRLRINDSSNMKMEFGEMKEGKWVFLAVFTQPSDWLICKQGGTVASMLIDVHGFWAHDNRESLLQEEEEVEEE